MRILQAIIVALAFAAIALAANEVFADHHPVDICRPFANDGTPPTGGGTGNCARGGEPQDFTFAVHAKPSDGDTRIWTPIRWNDLDDNVCEFGVVAHFYNAHIKMLDFHYNFADMTSEEIRHIWAAQGGTSCIGRPDCPPNTAGVHIWQTRFTSIYGGPFTPSPETDAPNAQTLRWWIYNGNNLPLYSLADRQRIFGWVEWEIRYGLPPGTMGEIVQSDSFVSKKLAGVPKCMGFADDAEDAFGGGGDPSTAVETWRDEPDGSSANQLWYTIDCWTADFNRDGHVNIADFGIFKAAFGQTGMYADLRPDANNDGVVGVPDFSAFKERWDSGDATCH